MERTEPNGADALEKRLQDPDTRRVLVRLLDRLDTIEEAMDTLEQMPDVLRTTTDMVDDELTRAADRDVVLDERAREALTLAEKLTEPETVEILSGLIDRLDRLEQVAALADDLPDATMVAAETIDDALTRAADRGVVVDERAREGLMLLEKMTDPDTAAALAAVLDRSEQLERLAELADTAPEAIATVVDILDAEYARIAAQGADPEQVLRQTVGALGRLGDLFRTDEFEALLDSGVLDPEALQAVGSLGTALAESQTKAQRGEIPSRGVFGLLGALRDPDVQRAVGFVTTFAKLFGQKIDPST
ncbi:MAG: DUF1641 domain-containing protein [Salinibacter sp.]